MRFDPILSCMAVLFAFIGWFGWQANMHQRRIRAAMTEEERKADDEEMQRWSQEW